MEYGPIKGLVQRGCFFPHMHENASRLVIPATCPQAPSTTHTESRVGKRQTSVRSVPSVPVFRFRMCKFLPPQVCRLGDSCTFPHSHEERRAWNDAKRTNFGMQSIKQCHTFNTHNLDSGDAVSEAVVVVIHYNNMGAISQLQSTPKVINYSL